MRVLSSPRTLADAPAVSPDAVDEQSQTSAPMPMIEHFAMAFGVGVPFLGLIAAIFFAWGVGVGWRDLALLAGFYAFTILGVTVGYHRMFTHRALQAGPLVRFILGVGGSMSAQGPVLEWCAIHREHHKHSDRDGDPHSPHAHGAGFGAMFKGMIHAHFGWLFRDQLIGGDKGGGGPRVVADLLADPVLVFVDRLFWLWMLAGWIIPGAIGGLLSHSWLGAFTGFLWGGLVRTFLLHHVTWSINSVCHVWGTRPFDSRDHSRNNWLFGLLAFGEGWHNNHHAFPTSARHGLRWWEFDLTYLLIRGMRAVGWVWNVRVPPDSAIQTRRRKAVAPAPVASSSSAEEEASAKSPVRLLEVPETV